MQTGEAGSTDAAAQGAATCVGSKEYSLLNLRDTIRDPKFSDEQVKKLFDKIVSRNDCSPELNAILFEEMLHHRPELAISLIEE